VARKAWSACWETRWEHSERRRPGSRRGDGRRSARRGRSGRCGGPHRSERQWPRQSGRDRSSHGHGRSGGGWISRAVGRRGHGAVASRGRRAGRIARSRAGIRVGRARIGGRRARIGSGRARIGSGRARIGSGRPRIGSGRPRIGSGRPRIGSGRARIGSGRAWIGGRGARGWGRRGGSSVSLRGIAGSPFPVAGRPVLPDPPRTRRLPMGRTFRHGRGPTVCCRAGRGRGARHRRVGACAARRGFRNRRGRPRCGDVCRGWRSADALRCRRAGAARWRRRVAIGGRGGSGIRHRCSGSARSIADDNARGVDRVGDRCHRGVRRGRDALARCRGGRGADTTQHEGGQHSAGRPRGHMREGKPRGAGGTRRRVTTFGFA
jgi:hypothetical protein